MKLFTTIRPHITKVAIITTLFFFAFVTNVAWSQWSDPQQKPTGGNTPAPINEGSANQEKAGSLGIVGNLTVGVPGAGGTIISHNWTRQKNTNPTMIFEDTNGSNWYAHVNNNHFYLLQDYNSDSGGAHWDSLGRYPMEMARAEVNGIAYNWVRFGDQVRAGSFCDHNGGNCTPAGEIRNTANLVNSLQQRITALENAAPRVNCRLETSNTSPITCAAHGGRLTGWTRSYDTSSNSTVLPRPICTRIVCD